MKGLEIGMAVSFRLDYSLKHKSSAGILAGASDMEPAENLREARRRAHALGKRGWWGYIAYFVNARDPVVLRRWSVADDILPPPAGFVVDARLDVPG